ncbi:MAG: hypothetical protein ABR608_05200 [Pseudonocardiaceae bacterium]
MPPVLLDATSAQSVTWFVASLRDDDTHLGGETTDGTVTARCGRPFRPLARLNGLPLDPLQVFPTCAQSQRQPTRPGAPRR